MWWVSPPWALAAALIQQVGQTLGKMAVGAACVGSAVLFSVTFVMRGGGGGVKLARLSPSVPLEGGVGEWQDSAAGTRRGATLTAGEGQGFCGGRVSV